ncbi:hypothetical protein [Hyphomonas johnsonii]|uniref:NADH dehydrogenase subunit E n=1 Tax=Hyphomonas johnsonii MHS-2 TaxID=1280950 RepID=A0A059FEH3_9PROT|nr:hypothetical protein [Hyphomonas johnsonii]KCZ88923.1 hypothetical protein HJO_15439 [Hyphomonas johnsonii MHS-2]
MAWLLTHMWMALAAVGFFGLMLGWSVRGILLVGKLRTARVDRDVAQTELEQARGEIEGLYAAQRGASPGAAGGTDPSLRAELKVREQRVAELSAELSRSKSELQALKAAGTRPAVATQAVSAQPAAGKGEAEDASLVWRNRHLESRVRHLETTLHEVSSGRPVASVGTAAVVSQALAPAADTAEYDKLKWRADFLKQRVDALEAELTAQPTVSPAATQGVPEDVNEELARLRWRNRFLEGRIAYFEGDGAPAAAEVQTAMSATVEDEAPEETEGDAGPAALAGASMSDAILSRLEEADAAADLEDDHSSDDAEAGTEAWDDPDAHDEATEDSDAESDAAQMAVDSDDMSGAEDDEEEHEYAEEDDESDGDDPDEEFDDEGDDLDESDTDEDEFEDVDEVDDDDGEAGYDEEADEDEDEADEDEDGDEDEVDEDEDEDASLEVDAEQPLSLERPVAGMPDDLTMVGGIGPKIQEVLNELGIFHFDQIAAWTPENVVWVDNHLNFSGRISREGWVEQAAILSGDVADED